jgi:transcriptional regulator with XRE-family HTH domain
MELDIQSAEIYQYSITYDVKNMITAAQLRASRALLGIDQRKLADMSGLSLPTIQRMEASEGLIRGNVDSLMKLVTALDSAGIELIAENSQSPGGGRGVRLKA